MDDRLNLENEEEVLSHISWLVDSAERHLEEGTEERDRAYEYYNGKMSDLTSEDGRSDVVSRDLRDTVKKIMPSIMRTLLGNDNIVRYDPVSPMDEETAKQASSYVNRVILPYCDAERGIRDAILDALLVKTGILKWTAYDRQSAKVYTFTNLSEEAALAVMSDDDNEVFDYVESEETDPEVLALGGNPKRCSFKARRVMKQMDVKLEAVRRGTFLISPKADSIEEAALVGERLSVTRSELVAMGYDREKVRELPYEYAHVDDENEEHALKGNDYSFYDVGSTHAMHTVLIYDVYVKLDLDDDGIAEMYHVVYGGAGSGVGARNSAPTTTTSTQRVLLSMEPVDEAPYAAVIADYEPHQFEGRSLFEDIYDIMRIKTSLERSTLDNVYWSNNPIIAYDSTQVENPNDLLNPEFGQVVAIRGGGDIRQAVQVTSIPFVGTESHNMLQYYDQALRERTGISDLSGGVDPTEFQNMTATSAQIMSDVGVAQADMLIRNLARGGLKKAFKGILKLVVAHHDQPRQVKIDGSWHDYDPRTWNVDMDCTINIGLGAGSRERDLMALSVVKANMDGVIATLGAINPLVKPDQYYNVLAKQCEVMGVNPDQFFTRPDPQEVQQMAEAAQNQPNPEEMKLQIEQAKAEGQLAVEKAQLEADMQVKQAEIVANAAKDENAAKVAEFKEKVGYAKHRESLALTAQEKGLSVPPPMIGDVDVTPDDTVPGDYGSVRYMPDGSEVDPDDE